jgi:hypothetical protein
VHRDGTLVRAALIRGAAALIRAAGLRGASLEMSSDSAFHGIPHQIAAAHRTKTECFGSVPDQTKGRLVCVRNSLVFAQRMMFEVGVAKKSLRSGGFSYVSSGGKIFWVGTGNCDSLSMGGIPGGSP